MRLPKGMASRRSQDLRTNTRISISEGANSSSEEELNDLWDV